MQELRDHLRRVMADTDERCRVLLECQAQMLSQCEEMQVRASA